MAAAQGWADPANGRSIDAPGMAAVRETWDFLSPLALVERMKTADSDG